MIKYKYINIKKISRNKKSFIIFLASILIVNAAISTITFHRMGAPIELFDKIIRMNQDSSQGFLTNLHMLSEGLYFAILVFFFIIMSAIFIAVDANPKAPRDFPFITKGLRMVSGYLIVSAPVIILFLLGIISSITTSLLIAAIYLAALIKLYIKRKEF